MKEDIYLMIVALIKEHQTWLDVLDCDTKEEFVTVSVGSDEYRLGGGGDFAGYQA